VLQNSEDLGAKPALIDGISGRVIGYAQLTAQIRLMAANLSQRGFKKADVFPSEFWLATNLTCMACGPS